MRIKQDGVDVYCLPGNACCEADEKRRNPLDISECPLEKDECAGDCYYYRENDEYADDLGATKEQRGIKDSGDRTAFATGAVRDCHKGKGRMDLLPWEAIMEVAKHCEEGAEKYGERNCEKGIPMHSLLDSALRHLAKYMMGFEDEPHLRAAAWNVLFAMYMEQKHPEMQDIPSRRG